MHRMGTDGKSIVQLEIVRSGFSFDTSSHSGKIGSSKKPNHPENLDKEGTRSTKPSGLGTQERRDDS